MIGANLGVICAFLSSITWALGTSGYSELSKKNSAFAVNFSRAMVAFPLFTLTAFFTLGGPAGFLRGFDSVHSINLIWLLLSMISSYGLGDACFMWSTRSLGIPAALAISSIYPLWTALFGVCALGQSLLVSQLVGLCLTIAGVVVVILSGKKDASRTRGNLAQGVALAILTSLFWALNSVALARGGAGISPFICNTIRMSIALGMSFFFGRIFARSQPYRISFQSFKAFGWVFIIESFAGSFLFLYGLTHAPLAIASALSSLAPAIAVPVSWWMKLEKFSLPRTLGVCAVVVGVTLLIYTQ